jgi:hypothetical protein
MLSSALYKMRWSRFLDSPRNNYGQLTSSISIGDAEELLLKSGLIDKTAENAILSIHRLIQAAVLRNQSDVEKSRNIDMVVRILSWGFPDTWSEDVGHQFQAWKRCEQCLPHVNHLVGQRNKYQIALDNPQRYGELLLRCSWYGKQ